MEPKTAPASGRPVWKKIAIISVSVLVVAGIAAASVILISRKKAAEQVAMLDFIAKSEDSNRQEVYQQLLKFPQNPPTEKELSAVYQQLAKYSNEPPTAEELKQIGDQLAKAQQAKAEQLRQEYLASKKK